MIDHVMPGLQLELDDVTVETCMGKSFDVIIRYQLDPVWNQLVWNRDVDTATQFHSCAYRAQR